MKKVKIIVILLTFFLLQGVAVAQQTEESTFNPSSYTLNPKIKVGDSILMKADIAETDLGNGTVLPTNPEASGINYAVPVNGTLNKKVTYLGTNSANFTDTLRTSNGALLTQWKEGDSFTGIFTGLPETIMTTNSSLLSNLKFTNITWRVENCTGTGCAFYNQVFGNFSTTVNNNEVIINGTLKLGTSSNIRQFKIIYDKESGWLKEYYETYTFYDILFKRNDIFKLDLITTAVSSGAHISSLSGGSKSTPDFFAYQMFVALTVMSLFVIKKKKVI